MTSRDNPASTRATNQTDQQEGKAMKYPNAGDLQRETTSHLTANPWEVRSDTGLEGVFAERDTAEGYADEIRGGGASRVTVIHRVRLMPPRPPGAPPMYHTPRGRPPGVPNPSSFSEKGECMYERIKAQYEAKGDPRAAEIAARTVYASSNSGVKGLVKHDNPSQFTAKGQRVFDKLKAKLVAEGSDPVDAAMNAEMAMSQLAEQGEGDLMTEEGRRESHEFFGSAGAGQVVSPSNRRFREGVRVIFAPSPASMMLYSDPPAIGATGVVTTVNLGGGRRSSYLAGPGGGLVYVDWDLYPVQGVSPNDLEINQILERAKRAASGRTPTTRLSKSRGNPSTVIDRWESVGGKYWVDLEEFTTDKGTFYGYHSDNGSGSFGRMNKDEAYAEITQKISQGYFLPDKAKTPMRRVIGNPDTMVRERWTDGTTIVIERGAHGYTGWLESKGGGRIPISFGRDPSNAHEALELAKKFLRGVHGKNNPDDDFDTDILGGMESAIWVTSYADWVDEQDRATQKELGPGPGGNWEDCAPPAPASALLAAEDLYTLIERANGKTPGELFQRACEVDGCEWNTGNANLFGHYVAMQSMGHGVSWFDDHKKFPLKTPHFEAHSFDGQEVEWSPQIKSRESRQNGMPT